MSYTPRTMPGPGDISYPGDPRNEIDPPDMPEDEKDEKLAEFLMENPDKLYDLIDSQDAFCQVDALVIEAIFYFAGIEPHYNNGHLKPIAKLCKAVSEKLYHAAHEKHGEEIYDDWLEVQKNAYY